MSWSYVVGGAERGKATDAMHNHRTGEVEELSMDVSYYVYRAVEGEYVALLG